MVFSLRQLQEKCRKQPMALYIAVTDLTKAFDQVSRDGIFKVLPKTGCPIKLQSMIESFHTDTKGTLQFSGSSSEPFEIRRGVKQGCVLAPTLFGILKHAFDNRRNLPSYPLRWQALQPRRSQSKEKVRMVLIRACCLLMTQQLCPIPRRNIPFPRSQGKRPGRGSRQACRPRRCCGRMTFRLKTLTGHNFKLKFDLSWGIRTNYGQTRGNISEFAM